MYKKGWCTCKVVSFFCQSIPSAFLRFLVDVAVFVTQFYPWRYRLRLCVNWRNIYKKILYSHTVLEHVQRPNWSPLRGLIAGSLGKQVMTCHYPDQFPSRHDQTEALPGAARSGWECVIFWNLCTRASRYVGCFLRLQGLLFWFQFFRRTSPTLSYGSRSVESQNT